MAPVEARSDHVEVVDSESSVDSDERKPRRSGRAALLVVGLLLIVGSAAVTTAVVPPEVETETVTETVTDTVVEEVEVEVPVEVPVTPPECREALDLAGDVIDLLAEGVEIGGQAVEAVSLGDRVRLASLTQQMNTLTGQITERRAALDIAEPQCLNP